MWHVHDFEICTLNVIIRKWLLEPKQDKSQAQESASEYLKQTGR